MARTSKAARSKASASKKVTRKLDARPDTPDFRDSVFQPTLVEVPPHIDIKTFQAAKAPILDQGQEGACTGFALATVVHYLLRTRKVAPDTTRVSPRMLYDMARRYDEWRGEDYEGSSARGAMKGWFQHGVCSETLWPYAAAGSAEALSIDRARDALRRPLGAYLRVDHKDLVAMHCAIAEVGVLLATASVHTGWDKVKADGRIPFEPGSIGGHAFAIVGYDAKGFWIQNSWGKDWGKGGFCHVTYDDWLTNGDDAWVARLAVPIELQTRERAGKSEAALAGARRLSPADYLALRPHVVAIGNDGRLRTTGKIGTSPADVERILREDFPRLTAGWKKPRLLLYAHGGLVDEESALKVVDGYRKTMLQDEIYPLAFIWRTDVWTTICNILDDTMRKRRAEGIFDNALDFMLDRADDMIEPVARYGGGKALWSEMKENALLATAAADGGARFTAALIDKLLPNVEIHIAGHSAGSILQGLLAQYLTTAGAINDGPLKGTKGLGRAVKTATLWAPACTTALFKQCYLPSVSDKSIGKMTLFTLTDAFEQDDNCARIYNKSLLYLVSNAFEKKPRIPIIQPDGEALLGMEKFLNKDRQIAALIASGVIDLVRAPNTADVGKIDASRAKHHGDFDNDDPTVRATVARILGHVQSHTAFRAARGSAAVRERRKALLRA